MEHVLKSHLDAYGYDSKSGSLDARYVQFSHTDLALSRFLVFLPVGRTYMSIWIDFGNTFLEVKLIAIMGLAKTIMILFRVFLHI